MIKIPAPWLNSTPETYVLKKTSTQAGESFDKTMNNKIEILEKYADKNIIFFDGVCNLCTSSVQFLIQQDTKKQLFFASLQGELGQQVLTELGLPLDELHSIILYKNGHIFQKSDAILHLCKILGGIWHLGRIAWLLPSALRHPLYDWVARNRYRFFGRQENCWLPTPALKNQFLS
jgi:predicted DCC family thiol-disulfide oxidoreductase YuxK